MCGPFSLPSQPNAEILEEEEKLAHLESLLRINTHPNTVAFLVDKINECREKLGYGPMRN